MKALVVTELGTVPELRDVPEPVRGTGEALIELLAASINPVDLGVASGRFFGGAPPVPYVAGAEGVGRILEAGALPPGAIVWTGMQGLGISRDGVIRSAWTDRKARMYSDHLPVIADVVFPE